MILTQKNKHEHLGTSLETQWLRFLLSMQGVWVWSLVGEQRPHMPHGQKPKTQNRSNTVRNLIKTWKKWSTLQQQKLKKRKPSETPSERDNGLINWKTYFEQDANSPQTELYYRFYRVIAVKIKISAGFPEINKLIFKTFYSEAKNFESPKHSLKKLEDTCYLITRVTVKRHSSRQCGISKRI